MTFLILAIVLSGLLVLIFKGFTIYEVDILQAIWVNYLVCVVMASLTKGQFAIESGFWKESWFPYAFILGFIFVTSFTLIGHTVKKYGITVGAIMQKMSLIVSVTAAFILYKEDITFLKIFGILLAMLATILANIPKDSKKMKFELGMMPILVLVLSGIIEIGLQYVEKSVIGTSADLGFIAFLFLTAGIVGLTYFLTLLSQGKAKFERKSIIAGIVLGIPNFASIYYLMKTLGDGWDGSVVFPIINVGIIIFAAIGAIVIFKEKLSTYNWVGVFLAVLSIVIISL